MADKNFKEATFGLKENVAGALSYILGFITGIIFYVSEDENTFVRFHAMQSILVSGTLFVLSIVSTFFWRVPMLGFLVWLVNGFIQLAGFILIIFLIVKAFQGERYSAPIFGKKAEEYSRKK